LPGYIMVDNRESGGKLVERDFKTCHTCGATVEYESRPLGNFLRKFRIYKRMLPNGHIQSREEVGGESWCHYHDKITCCWCAEKATFRQGKCIGQLQIAAATIAAIQKGVDIYTFTGQLYIRQLITSRRSDV